ncbi:BTAD domain-containing putative transcriptional regulator [Streptomyces sp. NPDC006632]|uniref:AfsR/SARP family transcriptional regulator n=1 Tax=Streptomyces sp. NPDC006632 TaxID=3157182 RepID=UPI0033B0F4FD
MGTEFRLLGDVGISFDGSDVEPGTPRQRCVLAVLLLEADRPVPVDTLVDRVWGTEPPPRAVAALYSYMSRLRALRASSSGRDEWDIQRTTAGYVLRTERAAVDLFRFRDLVERARGATWQDAGPAYEQALALWRGRPLAGVHSDWLDRHRLTLDAERLHATVARHDLLLDQGRHAEVVRSVEALADAYPLDELLAHQHMLALYRVGRPAAALAAYEQLRADLVEQMGADPGPRLQELHQRILVFDDTLDLPSPGPPAAGPSAAVATGPSAARPPAPAPARVPRQLPAVPAGFLGRRDELRLLDALAARTGADQPAVCAITGMGGIGKTWLALRWAHQHIEAFPDGQLYAQLNGFSPHTRPAAPADVLQAFLMALGAAAHELPPDEEGRAALYRTLMDGRRVLVVLDNARDSAQVLPLLVGGQGCRTLVTSRNTLNGLKVRHGADTVRLGVLSEAEASRLFAERVGETAAARAPAMRDIVRACSGLPLALDIAAAHTVDLPPASLDQLAQDLRDPRTRLDALDAGDMSLNLRALFTSSEHALDPAAADLLNLFGLVPHHDASLAALAHLADRPPARTRGILRRLEEACLVRENRPGRYQMHDLVRLYAREGASGLASGTRAELTGRLIDFYVHTAHAAHSALDPHRTAQDPLGSSEPGPAPLRFADADSALEWFEDEYACLQEIVTTARSHGAHRQLCQLVSSLHTFRWRRGLFAESIRAWHLALDAARATEDASLTAHTRQRLAVALAQAGRHEEALPHLGAALAHFTDHDDLPGRTRSHHALAEVHVRINAYESSLPHFAQAVEGYRRLGNQVGESNALNGTGWALARLGRYSSGEEHCLQALPLLRLHDDGEGQAATWDTLAHIAWRTGRTERACYAYRQALGHFQAIGNANREADIRSNLADIHAERGDLEQARTEWTTALSLYRSQHRTDDARRVAAHLAEPGT